MKAPVCRSQSEHIAPCEDRDGGFELRSDDADLEITLLWIHV